MTQSQSVKSNAIMVPLLSDKAYAKVLIKKAEVFRTHTRTKKQIFISMITTFGLKPTMYSEEIIASDTTLDDLFREDV